MGVSARWPPWPLGGLPLTLPPSVGGGTTAPTAACVDLVQRHLGGGVPFEKLSKGLHSGSSRGSPAAQLGLRLRDCGGSGCGSSPFGFLLGKSCFGFPGLLQPSLLRIPRRQLRLRLGPLLSDLPSRGLDGVLFFFFFFINTRPKSKSPRPNSGRVGPSYRSDPIPLGQGQACGTRTGKRKMGTSRFLRKRIHGWRHASKRPFSGPRGTKNHAGVPGMWATA